MDTSTELKDLAQKAGNEIKAYYVRLSDLTDSFLEGNSKKHDTGKIIDSMQRYGFRDPMTFDPSLNGGDGGLVEGNGRTEALQQMKDKNLNPPRGIKERDGDWLIPVLFGVNAITEAEAISYSIEHNWSIAWGSEISLEETLSMFDEDALSSQIELLQEEESLPLSFGDDLEEILNRFELDGEEKGTERIEEDELPDLDEVEPIVKRGQIWRLGRHYLYCSDSTDEGKIKEFLGDRVPTFIWSDPPYGINIVSGKSAVGGGNCNRTPIAECIAKKEQRLGSSNASKPFGSRKNNVRSTDSGSNIIKVNSYYPIIGDDSINTAIASYKIAELIFPQAMHIWWGGNYYAQQLKNSSCWIVWDKDNTGDFADAELAWTNSDTAIRIFKHRWNGMLKDSEKTEKRIHPTQKPVALFVWCAEKYGKPDDIVFDPFLGSGISIIGAEQMEGDRICYGVELSERYCDVIIERYKNLTGENAVLERTL